jgi:DNA polymerase-3 subunit beta
MHLTIPAPILASAIARLSAIRPSAGKVAHIRMDASDDALTLSADNTTQSMRLVLPCTVTAFGAAAPQVAALAAAVQGATGDVQIKLEDQHWLATRAGKRRARVAGINPAEVSPPPALAPTWHADIPAATLRHLITVTRAAVCADEARPNITGARLEVRDGALVMVSTDGHRLHVARAEGAAPDLQPCTIPTPMLDLITRHASAGEVVHLRGTDARIEAECAGVVVASAVVEAVYPNWPAVVPALAPASAVLVDRKALLSAVQSVAKLASAKTSIIRLVVTPSAIVMNSQDPDRGECEDTVECQPDVDTAPELDAKAGMNWHYLVDALSCLEADTVRITIRGPMEAATIEPLDDSGTVLVVMPMRL